jgi:hypothetical protein
MAVKHSALCVAKAERNLSERRNPLRADRSDNRGYPKYQGEVLPMNIRVAVAVFLFERLFSGFDETPTQHGNKTCGL